MSIETMLLKSPLTNYLGPSTKARRAITTKSGVPEAKPTVRRDLRTNQIVTSWKERTSKHSNLAANMGQPTESGGFRSSPTSAPSGLLFDDDVASPSSSSLLSSPPRCNDEMTTSAVSSSKNTSCCKGARKRVTVFRCVSGPKFYAD